MAANLQSDSIIDVVPTLAQLGIPYCELNSTDADVPEKILHAFFELTITCRIYSQDHIDTAWVFNFSG